MAVISRPHRKWDILSDHSGLVRSISRTYVLLWAAHRRWPTLLSEVWRTLRVSLPYLLLMNSLVCGLNYDRSMIAAKTPRVGSRGRTSFSRQAWHSAAIETASYSFSSAIQDFSQTSQVCMFSAPRNIDEYAC